MFSLGFAETTKTMLGDRIIWSSESSEASVGQENIYVETLGANS